MRRDHIRTGKIIRKKNTVNVLGSAVLLIHSGFASDENWKVSYDKKQRIAADV
jgi:hypothetical protein